MTRKQRQQKKEQQEQKNPFQKVEPPITAKPRKPRLKQVKFEPTSPRQKDYADNVMDEDITFGVGCAGTGKTFVALTCAADLLSRKQINQIIITRPNVSTGDKALGFHRGTKQEKIMEWMSPALSVLKFHFGKEAVDAMIQLEMIRLEPLETLRGESFDDAFLLLDEAQNVSFDDMQMFLTRIGQNCTTVVNGDIEQTDLKQHSGLGPVVAQILKDNSDPNVEYKIPIHNFGPEDIVRSGLCKHFVLMFRKMKGHE